MLPSIKQEFKLRNFCLNYEHPYHFYTSTVEKAKHFYLVWRIFWFLFHCGGIIAIFIHAKTPYLGRLLAFATIQGYLCLTLTTLLDLIFVILFQYKWPMSHQDKHQHAMPWYFKINWFLSNIAYNGAFFITLIYWILLYNAGRNLGINIVEHAMNSVYTLLNIFVTNKPIRLLHFWHTLIWMVIYLIFLGIYYVSGGTSVSGHHYIYPFMDFSKPKQIVIYTFSLAIACPVFHVLIFLLYRTRLWLVQKYQLHCQSLSDISSSTRDLEIVT